jgi:hypothetical protein
MRGSATVSATVLPSRNPWTGLTWSAPAQLNSDTAVQAFTPSVQVQADGTIGVSYYDFRDDTADPATLLTSYWLTQLTDGVHWQEGMRRPP